MRFSYLQHRGLLINLISLGLFWVWQPHFAEGEGPRWLVSLLVLALLTEPWAMYYSMGVFNARREQLQIAPIWMHRQMGLSFWGICFWAGRLSLFGALLISFLQKRTAAQFMNQEWLAIPFILLLMVREGWIAYYMASQRSFPKYSERLDLLADAVLVVVITAGELLFKSLMADFGLRHPGSLLEQPLLILALILFMAIFYLPIRYVYTLEDFTFAQTRGQKIERLGSFLLVLLVLLMRN